MKFDVARCSDIPELCSLLSSLFAQELEFRPDQDLQAQGLKAIINSNDVGDILIVKKEARVVAMLNILYTLSTALGGRVGLLEDMVVCKSERGSDIGCYLLENALTFAKDRGCKRITLLTDHDNEGAHRFYEKHGFSQSSMIPFRQSL